MLWDVGENVGPCNQSLNPITYGILRFRELGGGGREEEGRAFWPRPRKPGYVNGLI